MNTRKIRRDACYIYNGDSLDLYHLWASPTVIISDGPYGIKGYPGDPVSHKQLPEIYESHIKKWSSLSTSQTTLWFWNTEVGWATVHPLIESMGWEYRGCNIWNKGIGHVAGRTNTQTLRKFPVVSEVCAQYIRPPRFMKDGQEIALQDWLRDEWQRTGLPMSKANEACGVKNAASRKYLTGDHLWYPPSTEMFLKLTNYANAHGNEQGKPYFTIGGKEPIRSSTWEKMQSKFYCPIGITNIWDIPAVRGEERIKDSSKAILHTNQKPLKLMDLLITASSDEGDVIWEPFGGLCSATIAAHKQKRRGYAAEVIPDFFDAAGQRLLTYTEGGRRV